jgi:hypothetical protein
VFPWIFLRCASAQNSLIRDVTTSSCPFAAAQCKVVLPNEAFSCTLAGNFLNTSAISSTFPTLTPSSPNQQVAANHSIKRETQQSQVGPDKCMLLIVIYISYIVLPGEEVDIRSSRVFVRALVLQLDCCGAWTPNRCYKTMSITCQYGGRLKARIT